MERELVKKAFSLAMAAQCKHDRAYQLERHSSYTIIAFHGSGSVEDWFSGKSFGETSVGLEKLFPYLKRIGKDEIALVNGKFLHDFQDLLKPEVLKEDFRFSDQPPLESLLKDPRLSDELGRAVRQGRKVAFTGYSSAGPIAILATILFLQQNRIPARCVTFGSPLIGDSTFGHALCRENWAQYFVHFVMQNDIIPRVLLAPLSCIKGELPSILPCLDRTKLESQARSQEASDFFCDVLQNASSVANYTACSFMGCTNSLQQTITSFVELSPYRPFGTYVFCTGEGGMFTLMNPDAILQLLFYNLQLHKGETLIDVACKSFMDHLEYQNKFRDNLWKEDVDLDHLLLQLPLSSGVTSGGEPVISIETATKELHLSTKAMLCVIAAKEYEKQKHINQEKIDVNRYKIQELMSNLEEYRARCEMLKIGYYNAFKLQNDAEDFQANIKRLELAGMWDEIIEKLKRYELPDNFECRVDWVELGTEYRHLMEALDIANYYRHFKDEDTGPYLQPEEGKQPRPKCYRYTQRWLEHAKGKPAGYFSESCFWAEVEDLHIQIQSSNQTGNGDAAFEMVKNRVLKLEDNVLQWHQDGQLREDGPLREVFFENSTFVKWWCELPEKHRRESQIAIFMTGPSVAQMV